MRLLLSLALFAAPGFAVAATSVVVTPATVVQGEPFLVQVPGAKFADVKTITFNGTTLTPFEYKGVVSALAATTLTTEAKSYTVRATFVKGKERKTTVTIAERPRLVKSLSIPQKLGGNTTAAAKKVVSTLASDNAALSNLFTQDHVLWSKPFAYPVANPVVTDGFGYQRDTVGYEIAHKGTDFRAPSGTPVLAANRGVVRLVKNFNTYGNTVVVDHGLGLFSMYMHLSKVLVAQGQLVQQGAVLGRAGDTGYANGAHLHLSVRIGNTSVDPEKFLALFK